MDRGECECETGFGLVSRGMREVGGMGIRDLPPPPPRPPPCTGPRPPAPRLPPREGEDERGGAEGRLLVEDEALMCWLGLCWGG